MRPSVSRAISLLIGLSRRHCAASAPLATAFPQRLLAVLIIGWSTTTSGADLSVAVAANFAATLRTLVHQYQLQSNDTVRMSVGSSGKLYAQIVQGAPYDIFLSADSELPVMLANQQLALRDSRFTYALGTLAVWHARGDPDNTSKGGLDLGATRIVALASPRHAPYGRAARQVLIAEQQWDALVASKRLALAESVGQAWHYAATGNADVAFVALSQLRQARPTARPTGLAPGSAATPYQAQTAIESLQSPDNPGFYWLPPQHLYAPIVQQGVILAASKNLAAARRFCAWLISDPVAVNIIHAAGYHTDAAALK